ncbi:CLUMA_CG006938, isoform A [Clunio marinus]|uniref:CLUMA_CG006938, isoform A n=1 Tax=Clunio marinus TaxID=568069 RepID=A0A1J1I0V9_9DIPT|nr:CLUMA_CG006938, isoform A [Clunio marinus]
MSARRKSSANIQPNKTQRNPLNNFNIKNETLRNEAKGTKPTCEAASVKDVLVMAVLHLCKKTIFFDVRLKVALYLAALFVVSLIGDFIPFPKSYFARSDNLFNVYFVKLGWFWTLLFSSPFLYFTNLTLCCGNFQRFLKHHVPRLLIATIFWYCWTSIFNVIENAYGRCNMRGYETKRGCLKAGHFWSGFDISGHVFILIYSSLVLIEEARPIVGWDNIKEHLRVEDHNRKTQDSSSSLNPLRNLNEDEITSLKFLYSKYTPIIKLLFVAITILQLLWDIMLVCTMLYYHRMVEKVAGGIIAICTWYFTYRAWYPSKSILPDAAGKGPFIYQQKAVQPSSVARRNSLLTNKTAKPSTSSELPKFMEINRSFKVKNIIMGALEQLVEMGFPKEKVEKAISIIGDNTEQAMEWLLAHSNDEEPISVPASETVSAVTPIETDTSVEIKNDESSSGEGSSSISAEAKSIKCEDCSRLFKTPLEVEFHATKSGHTNFSESIEEKKPLTEEEKKAQLKLIEEKIAKKRADREEKEKQESLDRERMRIKSGKDLTEVRRKMEEDEMKKIVEERKRDKAEEKAARDRVKAQIEADKAARRAKSGQPVIEKPTQSQVQPQAVVSPPKDYKQTRIQIRLPNGTTIAETFDKNEQLAAVRLFAQLKQGDEVGLMSFGMMTTFPRKVFGADDYEQTLEQLGLVPSATIIITRVVS